MGSLVELCPERSVEEVRNLFGRVETILDEENEGKLGRDIPATVESPYGSEAFVDGRIVYLPPRGRGIFVGDTHGDSVSTLAILGQTGFLERVADEPDLRLIFLGDMIDGKEDLKNLFLILSLKEKYPQEVVLLGGNHESSRYSPIFHKIGVKLENGYGERMGSGLYTDCLRVFEKMPLALVCGNGLVALHGGIPSRDVWDLLSLRDDPDLLEETLWNDPQEDLEERVSPARKDVRFSSRFGVGPFERFLEAVGGTVMVRSHKFLGRGEEALIFDHRLLTVFSTGVGSCESRFTEGDAEVPVPIFAEFDLQPLTKISLENIHPILYPEV